MSTALVTFCLLLVASTSSAVQANEPAVTSTGFLNAPAQKFVNSSKCLGPLGCFSNGPPFYDPAKRPVSLLPDDREVLDVKFRLYTGENPDDYQLISEKDREGLIQSNFNPEHKTYFIIHGFLDDVAYGYWIKDLVSLLLLRDEGNVIVVDWGRTNKDSFFQAVANIRAVGAETALLIKTLQDVRKADPERIHLIGHSLGGQTAGYAGERIKNLGRITGLDPAGPFFTDTDPSVRLDPTDANFVDVIHTDAHVDVTKGLGTTTSLGHVDFFPNSGDNQSGCEVPLIGSVTLDKLLTQRDFECTRHSAAICDHQRAIDFFIASVVPGSCMPVAQSCSDWNEFVNGKCGDCEEDGSRCAVMGINSLQSYKPNPKYNKFYLRTSGNFPFCLHQYQVTMVMGENIEAKEVLGTADIVIHGSKADFKAKLSHGEESFKPGSTHTYLVASRRDVGEFDSIDFQWNKGSGNDSSSDAQLYVRRVRISSLLIPSTTGRKLSPQTMCGKGDTPVPPGKTVKLSSNADC